ncbi:MAG: flagellar biosynthetic protein FliO [Candidatus Hydrogenedentes bacterium]|nr:flagellar biosynthetic protein FliO [Candidatus Hydrogenedentota bacterium]
MKNSLRICLFLLILGAWPQLQVFGAEPSFDAGTSTDANSPASPQETAAADTPPVSHAQEPAPSLVPDYWKDVKTGIEGELDKLEGLSTEAPQPATRPQSGWWPYLRGYAALFLVLAIVLVLGVAVRKLGKRSPLFAGAGLVKVLGKVHLNPRASLHLLRIGDKVLVVGVTPNHVSAVAEMDADAVRLDEKTGDSPAIKPDASSFLAQLQTSRAKFAPGASENVEDQEIASLRGDIERLQKYLQESSGESGKG